MMTRRRPPPAPGARSPDSDERVGRCRCSAPPWAAAGSSPRGGTGGSSGMRWGWAWAGGAGGGSAGCPLPPPLPLSAARTFCSSTAVAAALTSIPAACSLAISALALIPCSLAISCTRFLAISESILGSADQPSPPCAARAAARAGGRRAPGRRASRRRRPAQGRAAHRRAPRGRRARSGVAGTSAARRGGSPRRCAAARLRAPLARGVGGSRDAAVRGLGLGGRRLLGDGLGGLGRSGLGRGRGLGVELGIGLGCRARGVGRLAVGGALGGEQVLDAVGVDRGQRLVGVEAAVARAGQRGVGAAPARGENRG